MSFEEWAIKWNVSAAALQDLRALYVPPPAEVSTSEAATQAQLRVTAPKLGSALWRNNQGACKEIRDDADGVPVPTGRMIRYGLGNDSKKLNNVWKSSDLIGVTPVVVQPHHVGKTIGVFTAVEVKHPGWKLPENDRDRAQEAFLVSVCQHGGLGMFVTHESQYHGYVERIRS
ncbi:hypothetical protein G6M87_10825 [Rhizobium rhizogenes]|uniref:hypothetical protein n=1 Tax=Rhizobium rhizogenes TaxID=359 RepID=UPI001571BBEA|nr:hypothetical protein [Rhizobium rhizogenes]NTI22350.1 hypothetical protein [Rhizobium rhizogenes]QTG05938.1 hypothetical protein G6M87_10825 [Rhizobium rhizogenes]